MLLTIVANCDSFPSRDNNVRRVICIFERNLNLVVKKQKPVKTSRPQDINMLSEIRSPTLIPVNATSCPSLLTPNDCVGSPSSRMVPYFKILTASRPLFVTDAVSLRSLIEVRDVPVDGAETLTDRLGVARLKGPARAALAQTRATKSLENISTRGEEYVTRWVG
jgi:hypothetical protein